MLATKKPPLTRNRHFFNRGHSIIPNQHKRAFSRTKQSGHNPKIIRIVLLSRKIGIVKISNQDDLDKLLTRFELKPQTKLN
ncbi:hypothetical protein MHBO_000624 [Bonamia ostreae]|uniref:Uncharacterized protein n=1 Tax=Bonamia ostreae TaxID=126728 RepID=A0ABV2AGT9_9EUKA